jgi:hypothetical protein
MMMRKTQHVTINLTTSDACILLSDRNTHTHKWGPLSLSLLSLSLSLSLSVSLSLSLSLSLSVSLSPLSLSLIHSRVPRPGDLRTCTRRDSAPTRRRATKPICPPLQPPQVRLQSRNERLKHIAPIDCQSSNWPFSFFRKN